MKRSGISDERARQILQRAAEIDRAASEVVSLETLREAAREAGIAESSFDAALSEETVDRSSILTRRRWLVGAFISIATATLLFYGVARRVKVSPRPAPPDTPLTSDRR
jgi:hypothetical protein